MRTNAHLLVISSLILTASFAKANSLYGTQVTLTVDYPTFGNTISNSVTKTVGPDVEFPSGTLIDTLSGTYIVGANIDVQKASIDIASIQTADTLAAAFNGYVFSFADARILGATLDPASTFTSSQVPVTFGPTYVAVNEEGLFLTTSSNILIDLEFTTTTATPEPASCLLLSIGCLFVAFASRNRWRKVRV